MTFQWATVLLLAAIIAIESDVAITKVIEDRRGDRQDIRAGKMMCVETGNIRADLRDVKALMNDMDLQIHHDIGRDQVDERSMVMAQMVMIAGAEDIQDQGPPPGMSNLRGNTEEEKNRAHMVEGQGLNGVEAVVLAEGVDLEHLGITNDQGGVHDSPTGRFCMGRKMKYYSKWVACMMSNVCY